MRLLFFSLVNQAANITWPAVNLHCGKLSLRDSTESLISDLQEENTWDKEQPLFLHLSCSIHFRSELSSIPVKVLPTCFTEIIQRINDSKEKNLTELSLNDLKVTLDVICLSLPREVLEISLERYPTLRTTSYCSASPFGSMRTDSGSSPAVNVKTEPAHDKMSHLPMYQHSAIANLKDEIEWLLRDETATALLDHSSPSADTLRFIAHHVSDSAGRSSCLMDKVPLHFVFSSESSAPKFLKELKNLQIDKYCICQEGDLFYFVKKPEVTIPEVKSELEADLDIDLKEGQVELDVEIEEQQLKEST